LFNEGEEVILAFHIEKKKGDWLFSLSPGGEGKGEGEEKCLTYQKS